MNASELFKKYFDIMELHKIYLEKIKYRANVGMDRISPQKFENEMVENISIISRKVLSGTYTFTRYRQILINKGKGKAPRVISIPTIRDKLVLATLHKVLQETFKNDVEEPLLHTIIGEITHTALGGCYNGYVKLDITRFYSSINHNILIRKIKKRIRKKEVLSLLVRAISTETIENNVAAGEKNRNDRGVPEGLSISNILADIYLAELKQKILDKYEVKFYRYVDDILILCSETQAEEIAGYCKGLLENDYDLKINENKTKYGKLDEGVSFLGYLFFNNKVSIRSAAEEKLENSIESLFGMMKKGKISYSLFIWKLNLRIAGCILESHKYGWMFYYSQLTDLKILYHLDWLVEKLFDRYRLEKPKEIKRFVRVYHEITKNLQNSNYLINADRYTFERKIEVLSNIYNREIKNLTETEIDNLFKDAMFREVQYLENDIQNFS